MKTMRRTKKEDNLLKVLKQRRREDDIKKRRELFTNLPKSLREHIINIIELREFAEEFNSESEPSQKEIALENKDYSAFIGTMGIADAMGKLEGNLGLPGLGLHLGKETGVTVDDLKQIHADILFKEELLTDTDTKD